MDNNVRMAFEGGRGLNVDQISNSAASAILLTPPPTPVHHQLISRQTRTAVVQNTPRPPLGWLGYPTTPEF